KCRSLNACKTGGVHTNLRTSPKHLRLTDRFKFEATITGMLVTCRKSLTKKLDRSASPEGWALNRLPALSGSLERTRHSTTLPFAH
ncbi:hypothetical protein, partial [uncultured Neptuniibacter sp.]|uniref:hypothetical protein n=1 Tax=uncultured Neptuniibacter sp. TaxID=502143 RepID=UPI0032B12696